MKRVLFIASLALAAVTMSCSHSETKEQVATDSLQVKAYPQGFAAYKGVNISHWLSQVFGWSPRATFFTEEDVQLIKQLGFDHIRLPIDEENLWDTAGNRIPEGFADMIKAIEWCKKADLRVIVDLHIIRSHHFNANHGEGKMTLWDDSTAQNKFFFLWEDLSKALHEYPTNFVAYELMNEPAAPRPEQWNSLVARAAAHVRKLEPQRILFIGANRWQTIDNLKYLEIPQNDTNIVIAFHSYEPLLVTHHLASWTGFKDYTGPVQYPGLSAKREDLFKQLDSTKPEVMEEINRINGVYNHEVFDSMFKVAIKRAKELNVGLYCGEFGCLPNIDTAMRHLYYRDFVGLLNKYHIGRANWDYKGAFQTVGYDAKTMKNAPIPDSMLVKILTQ